MTKAHKQREELEQRITELENSLGSLKVQLRECIETEQHEAIDDLDKYLDEVNHRYVNLRDFWEIVSKELRETFHR